MNWRASGGRRHRHAAETERWAGPHHALAMEATAATVLILPCEARPLRHCHQFLALGRQFIVRTDGPDGACTNGQIASTFGIHPCCSTDCNAGWTASGPWRRDSRPKDQGGQRWLISPDRKPPAGDRLH
jgi:hypothetical protein